MKGVGVKGTKIYSDTTHIHSSTGVFTNRITDRGIVHELLTTDDNNRQSVVDHSDALWKLKFCELHDGRTRYPDP